MTSAFIKPYRTGDVVKYVGARQRAVLGDEMIVLELQIRYGSPSGYAYSTTKGAWYSHFELELVRECDEKSMTALWATSVANDIYEELSEEEDEGPLWNRCLEKAKETDPWTNERVDDDVDDDEDWT